ncbi:unnamed protein product [Phytomonas sp. Hart1]|nr:unnamed protein product [Phytomonas sp. Hart1]|eukprot:CCW68323.1 unnamed protein product [Phytomonas sp. isolate Hart1]
MNSDEASTTRVTTKEQVLTIANGNFSQSRQAEPMKNSIATKIITDCTPTTSNFKADKGEKTKVGVLAKLISGQSISEAELKEVSSEMLIQEKIIVALQKDNEVLRSKNKELSLKNNELINYIANLEAKHSLLVSSVESEAQINQKRVDDIQRLMTTINELKCRYEELENSKIGLQARLKSIEPRKLEDKCTFTDGFIVNEISMTGGIHHGNSDSKHVSWAKGSMNTQEMGLSDHRKMVKKNCEPKGSQTNSSNFESSLQNRQETHVSNTNHGSKISEESRLLRMKDSRIHQLEDALMEKERYMASALQRLKGESDIICSKYNERIYQLELKLKDKEQTEGVEKKITQYSHNIDSDTVLLNEKLLKYEKLLSDNYRSIDVLNKHWERCVEDMKKNHSEQLRLIHKNHDDEINRLRITQQVELDRITKMKNTNEDIKLLNHKLIKMAGNGKSEKFLLAVLDRLNYLEKRCKQREEDAAFEISESIRVVEIERRLLEEKMALIIEEKNQQIKRFQIELDDLLAHIKSLADPKNLVSAQVVW